MLDDYNWMYEKYVDEGLSFSSIAEELDTYSNKVRRAAIKLNIPLRNRSEAQKVALATNKKPHPTKGKRRSEATKLAISDQVSNTWKNKSGEDKAEQIQKMKDNWKKIPALKKEEMREAAAKAIRKTSVEGSKLEKFLKEKMEEEGYEVEFHKKDLLINKKLEVDLYLPEYSTVVEVDGPSHFQAIWGEEKFQATVRADNEKNGLILQQKMNIIRIKQLCKSMSGKVMRDAWSKLKVALEANLVMYNEGTFGKIIDVEIDI